MGEQYVDTGKIGVLFTLAILGFILFNIWRAQQGKKDIFIRKIPGLNALDDAIGRATEMGRPILMVPGIGALNAIAVQAVRIFSHVTRIAAQFNTPIRLCCANAAVYTIAQEVIRDTYQSMGLGDRYEQDSVRFISDRQFAFAAGVSGIILRERAAATFFLGEFFAESLIFAETANSVGAIQIAGSTQTTQTPFFIAACDYVLIGDEFYAASAYLSREPILVGSLIGQDWAKIAVFASVLVGSTVLSIEQTQTTTTALDYGAGVEVELEEERFRGRRDTVMFRIFNPFIPADERQIDRPPREDAVPDEVVGDPLTDVPPATDDEIPLNGEADQAEIQDELEDVLEEDETNEPLEEVGA